MKKYIVIAGVNGAGKSTLYQTLDYLKIYDRVNTDEIVREFGRWDNPADSIKAGKIAVKKVKNNIEEGVSFNQETTLCGNSIISNILKAKEKGFIIELHYVGVESPEIAKKVKATNRFGAITYVTTAVIAGFSAFVANKVRDKIAHPKEV